jgi:hypothetical protein
MEDYRVKCVDWTPKMPNNSVYNCSVNSPSDLYFVNKGLIFGLGEMLFKKEETFNSFLSILEEEYQIEKVKTNGRLEVFCDQFRIEQDFSDEMLVVYGRCIDFDVVRKINDIYLKTTEGERESFRILLHSYYLEDNRLRYSDNLLCDEFVPRKYYIPYIDTDEMFNQFFNGDENILILVGKSGVGKSKLSSLGMMWLSENKKNMAVIASVKNPEILANEEFWISIKDSGVDLVLLDDLDFMLNSRTDERSQSDVLKNKFLSSFLTFTDGFRKNKIKFIITTNQEFKDIDTAILRKGRLFDVLELRDLTFDEAKNVCKEENIEDDFLQKKSICASDLAHEISIRKKSFNKKEYLKDKSISKKNNISSKIGF